MHPESPVKEPVPYRPVHLDLPPDIKIPEPMPDEPPVPPIWALVTTFSYVRGKAPPGMYTKGYLPFAGAAEASRSGGGGGQLSQPPQPPPVVPQLWALPRYPPLPMAPNPPDPWVLTAGSIALFDDFKSKILKDVDPFKGESTDISCFFLQCKMHFDLWNTHY